MGDTMETCPRCLMSFPQHIVVRARCTKRWRGSNMDAQAAEGNVGAAVAGALGMSVRTSAQLEAFYRKAFVRAYGERRDASAEVADVDEGEAYEFHVGLREDVLPDLLVSLEKAVRDAVAGSRSFTLA